MKNQYDNAKENINEPEEVDESEEIQDCVPCAEPESRFRRHDEQFERQESSIQVSGSNMMTWKSLTLKLITWFNQ